MQNLIAQLRKINNQSYAAYKSIKGAYHFAPFKLIIDHVQGDPFATPTRLSMLISISETGFSEKLWCNSSRKNAFEDFIARKLKKSCQRFAKGNRGSGKSGEISISCNRQQVLKRNAVQVREKFIEVRMTMGLPANGRRIAGHDAEEMFACELPKIVEQGLLAANLHAAAIERHVNSVEDQDFLRSWLVAKEFVAFVANDSVLPRRSGVDDRPLLDNPIKFISPESLEVGVELPNQGLIKGMAIPKGVTLIVGGGFHGKSTLLNAIELGVYNHLPGDGRERIATDESAVKIRAEDGRAISNVNISCFIDHLPFGKATRQFSTENASGSTSQAANIVEAITGGARLLLIDEDTSASNFMIRDARMQALVADDKEPITPLVFRIRDLYEKHDISSIIVMGGSGDYFSVADHVIMMDEYQARDVSAKAKAIAAGHDPHLKANPVSSYIQLEHRKPQKSVLFARRGKYEFRFDVRNIRQLRYGERDVDLSGVEQLIDSGQTETIAWIMKAYLEKAYDNTDDVVKGVEAVIKLVEEQGLDCLPEYKIGTLAIPRKHEILAAINRIRG